MSGLRISQVLVLAGALTAVMQSAGGAEAADGIEFRGIRLNMSEAQAVEHINRIAPGAFVGSLCTGNRGVGSYLEHRGLDWQIMAHTADGWVREIKLFRFDRAETKTAAQCTARFEDLLAEQKAAYPNAKWVQSDTSGGRYKIKRELRASLTKSISIELHVARLDWDQARCSIEMLISRSDPDRERLSQGAPAE